MSRLEPMVRWLKRQQYKPVVGPLIRAGKPLLQRRTNVVSLGRASGLRINPAGGRVAYALGIAEPLVQDALAANVRAGDVVWDVGANIGFFTLISARLAGPEGRVVAFEPMPPNADALRANLAANQADNVEVVELALGDSEGTAELQVYDDPGWAKLDTSADTAYKSGRPVSSLIEVPLSTLDRQLDDYPPPRLLKIDIEGGEVAALRGARRLLSEHRPVVLCELHGTNEAICELLEAEGYELSTIEAAETHPRSAFWNAHVLAVPPGRREQRPSAVQASGRDLTGS